MIPTKIQRKEIINEDQTNKLRYRCQCFALRKYKHIIASHMTYVLNVDRHRLMWNHAYVLYEETNINLFHYGHDENKFANNE